MDRLRLTHREPPPDRYGRLRVEHEDLGPARWLEQRPPGQGGLGTVAGVAAPGFAAYARVLHPAGLDERPVRWDAVGAAYGRSVSGATRWHQLIGSGRDCHTDSAPAVPGVWDELPEEGPTPAGVARALMPVLARHTSTPDRCWYGLWAGYGTWDWDGVPTFATPGRDEILLSGALTDAVSPAAELDEIPDLWWPEDRAWCVGGDVGLVSTYIGGSEACIAELLAAPGLEAHPVDSAATPD